MSLSNYPDSVSAADIEDVFGDPDDDFICPDCGSILDFDDNDNDYCPECEVDDDAA